MSLPENLPKPKKILKNTSSRKKSIDSNESNDTLSNKRSLESNESNVILGEVSHYSHDSQLCFTLYILINTIGLFFENFILFFAATSTSFV